MKRKIDDPIVFRLVERLKGIGVGIPDMQELFVQGPALAFWQEGAVLVVVQRAGQESKCALCNKEHSADWVRFIREKLK